MIMLAENRLLSLDHVFDTPTPQMTLGHLYITPCTPGIRAADESHNMLDLQGDISGLDQVWYCIRAFVYPAYLCSLRCFQAFASAYLQR
jgi:hypothetical protein